MFLLNQILTFTQIALETVPVSSSAHVLLAKKIYEFFAGSESVFSEHFYQLCNIPTLIVLGLYFRKEIWDFIPKKTKDFDLENEKSPLYRLLHFGSLGVIACAITVFFYLTTQLMPPHKAMLPTTPVTLILAMTGSLLALLSLRLIDDKPSKSKKFELGIHGAALLGIVQSISLAPGVSRFATTYVACRWLGNGGRQSIRFSFFLHALLSSALFVKSVFFDWARTQSTICEAFSVATIPTVLLGIVASIGLLAFADRIAKQHNMWRFSLYYPLPILATILLSLA